ncbi:MFS transporter [Coleofasciculus sp. FACHB-129]|uniref:MDR family MFS transporter n=1 Tax=Cyanophyceae TaxID=3028117 RepID=UPI0016848E47|nr:MFS transporter [Coleofasciculus sp. FACHB-129]MBD1897937.1 MFS transporter [Coleofasciculus sp. FACHB-129]
MTFFRKATSWLPQLNSQVWILAAGRFLSGIGTGFTLFYAPIFFVNQVGLSATQVGLGLGSASISGVVGRILGGSFADSQFWGRRRTLLLSAAVSAVASLVLAISNNFHIFVVGNLLMGMGIGLYWPATEAVVADLTQGEQRNEAYALTRLADNLGMGIGIVLGGVLIGTTGAYRELFVLDAISFVVFFGVVYAAIAETYKPGERQQQAFSSWATALRDRSLLIFCLVNIIFTTYISQTQSTMPLYFSNFLRVEESGKGFSPTTISALFTWHLVLAILLQLPVVRIFKRLSHPYALCISALFWGLGFSLIWFTGVAASSQLVWAILAMGVFAIALVSYTPSASSLITVLAPESQRGVYFSINSLCWAIGYFIGPTVGGWALDQPPVVAHGLWLGFAFSVAITIAILQYLNRILNAKNAEGNVK